VLVRVIGLAECLLPSHIILPCKNTLGSWSSVGRGEVAVVIEHGTPIVESLLLFLGAFLEEYFAEYVLFFLMRVIILHVVIMWLVENAVRIMIAVRVLISYSPSLTHGGVWIYTKIIWSSWHLSWLLAVAALACDEEDAFVETADHWDLRLSGGLLTLSG
jgi:hypothetical protein